MKFREFFSAPEGKRITEKYLYKVLISSICSILLCMGCLAGTTWAWFTVSIENEGNVIRIEEPEVTVHVVRKEDSAVTVAVDDTIQSGGKLAAGAYTLTITRSTNTDDLNQDMNFMKFYASLVISYVEGEENITKIYKVESTNSASIDININTEFNLNIEISWLEPLNAELVDNSIEVTVEETEPTEESTMTGEETADPTGTGTDHTGETTAPPETETDPTKETTSPPESSEVTSQPAESESEPAETEAVTESATDAGGNET